MAKIFKFNTDGSLEVTDFTKQLVNGKLTDVGAVWSMNNEQAVKHGLMFNADMSAEEKATLISIEANIKK